MQWVAIFILVFSGGMSQNRLEAFDNKNDCETFLTSYIKELSTSGFFTENQAVKYYGICPERTKPVIKIW